MSDDDVLICRGCKEEKNEDDLNRHGYCLTCWHMELAVKADNDRDAAKDARLLEGVRG
jgi:hypothetical protein